MDSTRLPDDVYDSEGCGGGNAASSTTDTASLTGLVQRMLLRLDELDSRTSSIQQPPPQKPIPATPADGLEGDDEEDDPSPGFPAKSLDHAAFIDPRDWIDYLPRAYAESMPPVGLTNPGLWNPRNDEWDRYLTDEKKHATSIATCCAMESLPPPRTRLSRTLLLKTGSPTSGVSSARRRLPARSESPRQRLVYSRFFDTTAAERSSNGVDGLLNALDDKRLEVSLHQAAKAHAAAQFKGSGSGGSGGGNGNIRIKAQEHAHADRATNERADKNKDKDKIKGKP
eukprot:jgi/Tetstr1/444402/TSEL_032291.t1